MSLRRVTFAAVLAVCALARPAAQAAKPLEIYFIDVEGGHAPVILHALKPRVAIMNNGPKKGGSVEAMTAIRALPGLEDFWQLHYSVDARKDANMPERMIANLDESAAHFIKLTAQRDGSFTVTNSRTKETKGYRSIR